MIFETKQHAQLTAAFATITNHLNTLTISPATATLINGAGVTTIDTQSVLDALKNDTISKNPSFLDLVKQGLNITPLLANDSVVESELSELTSSVNELLAYQGTVAALLPLVCYSKKDKSFVVSEDGNQRLQQSCLELTKNEQIALAKINDLKEFLSTEFGTSVTGKVFTDTVYSNWYSDAIQTESLIISALRWKVRSIN